jgi:hypothetical protein
MATALKRHPRGISLQAMGDCSDQVHSDHTILETVRWEAGPQKKKRQPKVLKTKLTQRDHHARVDSDQMVLLMVIQEAGPSERRPKGA